MAGLAVVTGASSGIGREIARQLGAKGIAILAVARREDRPLELQQELEASQRVQVFPLVVDLSKPDAEDKIVAEIDRSRCMLSKAYDD